MLILPTRFKNLIRKAVVVKKGYCHIGHAGKNLRMRKGPYARNKIMQFTDRETNLANSKYGYLVFIPL